MVDQQEVLEFPGRNSDMRNRKTARKGVLARVVLYVMVHVLGVHNARVVSYLLRTSSWSGFLLLISSLALFLDPARVASCLGIYGYHQARKQSGRPGSDCPSEGLEENVSEILVTKTINLSSSVYRRL